MCEALQFTPGHIRAGSVLQFESRGFGCAKDWLLVFAGAPQTSH